MSGHRDGVGAVSGVYQALQEELGEPKCKAPTECPADAAVGRRLSTRHLDALMWSLGLMGRSAAGNPALAGQR